MQFFDFKGRASLGAALLVGSVAWGSAQALPSLSIVVASGSNRVAVGASNASVTFDVVIDAGTVTDATTWTNVVSFHDVFFAYDPSVLTLTGFSKGGAMGSNSDFLLVSADYNDAHATLGTGIDSTKIDGLALGQVGTEVTDSLGAYRPGSLEFLQSTSLGGEALYDIQSGGATLFSVTFDIVTTAIAYSSVVLIDDSYYVDFSGDLNKANYDYKLGTAPQVSEYLTVADNVVKVPVPAPLALMALGLFGFGATRRRARA